MEGAHNLIGKDLNRVGSGGGDIRDQTNKKICVNWCIILSVCCVKIPHKVCNIGRKSLMGF